MSVTRDYGLTSHAAQPCAAANPTITSRLQSSALVGRVAELGSLEGEAAAMKALLLVIATTVLVSSSVFAFYYMKLFIIFAADSGPVAFRRRGRFLLFALLAFAVCFSSGWFLSFLLSRA